MKCPNCSSEETKVVTTKGFESGKVIKTSGGKETYRRRICKKCSHRFITRETPVNFLKTGNRETKEEYHGSPVQSPSRSAAFA